MMKINITITNDLWMCTKKEFLIEEIKFVKKYLKSGHNS